VGLYIPEFVLTPSERVAFSIKFRKFTYPSVCYQVPNNYRDLAVAMFESSDDKHKDRAFVIKVVSELFTQMRLVQTNGDIISLINSCMLLYAFDSGFADRLLSLVRALKLPKADLNSGK
jgi:hypothetical protein